MERCGRHQGKPLRMVWGLCVGLLVMLSLAQTSVAQSCNGLRLSQASFNTTPLKCREIFFHDYFLWTFLDNSTNVASIVVSAPLSSGKWIGLGFSKLGYMIGSSAMVATLDSTGTAKATEYYLKNKATSQVVRDSTRFQFVTPAEAHYDNKNATVYMAFQVNLAQSLAAADFLLYAYGELASDGSLLYHDSRYMYKSDFTTGILAGSTAEQVLSTVDKLRRAHGTVNILGGGVLLPVGAFIARYCRAWDPAWFYVHAAVQVLGYSLLTAGLGTGIAMTQKVTLPGLNRHRGLGIFIFVLACLQVLAVVLRPKKDAKFRHQWNLYHAWVGRFALFLIAVNVILGLRLANAERSLRIGYGFIAAIEILLFLVLETIFFIRWRRRSNPDGTSADKDSAFNYGGSM